MAIFVMSDLELPIRGRTYREPEGPHSVVVRGRDIEAGLQHMAAREDCRAMAVVGLPAEDRDLSALAGRRLFLVDSDGARLRDFAEIALRAEADVEWIRSGTPPFDRLADALLPVGAIVLAAGSSSRMPGSQKLLLEFDGRPMISSVIEAASDGGCHQVLVVYSADDVKQAVGGDAELVHNPNAETGMASSLKVGLAALNPDMVAALVMLGDQPMVGSRTVSALLRAWRREGSRPAVAVSRGDAGKWAPPVILSRELFDELMTLEGDAGARQVLDRRPELVDTVPSLDRLDDVDTPEDYAKIVRLFPRPNPTQTHS
ncbi:MAG TPA: nucleotidyltransferase family protein [Candidatus Dormibacteraeota bacterium]|nr:nucleotidyltransferase family protein [Candidatus Dormibacteraeota bacterium]